MYRYLKPILIVALILAVASAWAAKLASLGLLTILFGVFIYVPVTVAHIRVHLRPIRNSESIGTALLPLILFSHLALLLAFLLQFDKPVFGRSWLTITALLYLPHQYERDASRLLIPAWWEHFGPLLNIVTFMPLIASWFLVGRKPVPDSA